MDTEKLLKRIEFCENTVNEFAGDYDILDALTGNEPRTQKIYSLCVKFLDDLDKIMDDFTENAKKCL
jgi:hypothetical protein